MIFDITFEDLGGYVWPKPPKSEKFFRKPPEIAEAYLVHTAAKLNFGCAKIKNHFVNQNT